MKSFDLNNKSWALIVLKNSRIKQRLNYYFIKYYFIGEFLIQSSTAALFFYRLLYKYYIILGCAAQNSFHISDRIAIKMLFWKQKQCLENSIPKTISNLYEYFVFEVVWGGEAIFWWVGDVEFVLKYPLHDVCHPLLLLQTAVVLNRKHNWIPLNKRA